MGCSNPRQGGGRSTPSVSSSTFWVNKLIFIFLLTNRRLVRGRRRFVVDSLSVRRFLLAIAGIVVGGGRELAAQPGPLNQQLFGTLETRHKTINIERTSVLKKDLRTSVERPAWSAVVHPVHCIRMISKR